MTDQIFISSKYARSEAYAMDDGIAHTGVRGYRDSPFTLTLQVMTKTGKQRRISGLAISAKEAREVAAYLLRKADELNDDPGRAA
jgi:hypothetical protein